MQLADSDNEEVLAHLIRAFLVKNRDIEFIRVKVSPSIVTKQCKVFAE